MTSRLGYQIPNFTYPDTTSDELFAVVANQAREAEDSGFDRVLVMDHFYQLPGIGDHDEPMLECYTLLSALAQQTNTIGLSALVTGNTYRNPALLAKVVTALDIVSGGRATLGIGAGWFELEHQSFGFEFGTFTDRFEKLEESLQIIGPMLRGETVNFSGKHYTVTDGVNSPPPVSKIPIMIGGSGEKKTLRMVAQYADESNLLGMGSTKEIPRKLEALDEHCERLGRDRSEITVSILLGCNLAETMEQADADLRSMAAAKKWSAEAVTLAKSYLIHGDPDTVGERLQSVKDAGVDGMTINLIANGHVPGRIALLGEVAGKVLG